MRRRFLFAMPLAGLLAVPAAAAPAARLQVVAREFSRTERLLIRFPAYGPSDAAPDVSAKLLGRMGHALRDLTVSRASTPGGENAIDLPLASLAAGEYLVEVEAATAAGDAKDRVGFRVTP